MGFKFHACSVIVLQEEKVITTLIKLVDKAEIHGNTNSTLDSGKISGRSEGMYGLILLQARK
jgi:hypothetical protein